MAPVLLVTAGVGIVLMLRTLWVCFAGDGPYLGQLLMGRFVDRATTWVTVGPGSASSWGTLAALTAFTVVVLSRSNREPAVPTRLRLTAMGLAALLALLELSGPLTVATGWFLLSRDPKASGSFWDHDLINGPELLLCVVLGILATLVAWVLRGGVSSDDALPDPQPPEPSASTPWADEPEVVGLDLEIDDLGVATDYPPEIYRRPVR